MGKEKAVLVLSGGMDSATLLSKLVADNYDVYAISFHYGQRHSCELDKAISLTDFYNVKHLVFPMPKFGGSSLTDDAIDVPEGHYASDSMKSTVVPNRNMIMLSIAAGYAESIKVEKVFYGAHGGDHHIYWDCRPEFLDMMNAVIKLNDILNVQIIAPFISIDKGDIACIGKALGTPYHLTWTCYTGDGKVACGKCGSCVERLESFEKAGMKDPVEYE